MRLYFLLSINFFLLLSCLSCKKRKPADEAFFLRADPVKVFTNPNTQGSGANKITDIFLYVNGQFQGVYPVGNLMPVVTKGEKVTIDAFAGIKNNGISETRVTWVFYDYIEFDTLVPGGKTIVRPLTFHYNNDVIFSWLENFDSNTGITIRKAPNGQSDTNFVMASPADSYEGRSLEMGLVGSGQHARLQSTTSFSLPVGAPNLYLEVNYKCTQNFEVGVIPDGDPTIRSAVGLNPTDTWNKVYIQLSSVVSQAPTYSKYFVYFEMYSTDDNPNPKLFLDNIKLVHF